MLNQPTDELAMKVGLLNEVITTAAFQSEF
jgi:hypothetical protein